MEMKRIAPELTSAQLRFGNKSREPVHKIDLAFLNKDYFSNAVKIMNRAITKQVSGSDQASLALDASFQFFRHLREKLGPIIGGHFGERGDKEPHIYFMTPEMEEIIQRAPDIHCPGL